MNIQSLLVHANTQTGGTYNAVLGLQICKHFIYYHVQDAQIKFSNVLLLLLDLNL
jgi:hypothetical protein